MQSLLKLTLISCCCILLSMAGNVGRQRRVQTSATAAGPALPQLLGSHLWYTTYDTDDEYVETPFQRRAANRQQQQQQQPKNLNSNIYAEEQVQPEAERSSNLYGDVLPATDLSPAQVQQLLLFNTPRVFGSRHQLEPRFFHNMHLKNNLFPNNSAERNHTNVNNNFNNVTVINPPAAAAALRLMTSQALRSPQLMSYFDSRQGQDGGQSGVQGLRLPYELIDLYGGIGGLSYANNMDNGINNINGINGISGLGAGVPLVPVTLGNNAVGYVPLNLRMFRQLQQAAQPNTEDEAATASVFSTNEQNQLEPDLELESIDGNVEDVASAQVTAPAAPEDKLRGSRFQMFGQRLRQRPVNDGLIYPMRNNPLMTFAKNMRRVQYV